MILHFSQRRLTDARTFMGVLLQSQATNFNGIPGSHRQSSQTLDDPPTRAVVRRKLDLDAVAGPGPDQRQPGRRGDVREHADAVVELDSVETAWQDLDDRALDHKVVSTRG